MSGITYCMHTDQDGNLKEVIMGVCQGVVQMCPHRHLLVHIDAIHHCETSYNGKHTTDLRNQLSRFMPVAR